jgi:conjugal transfer ATP-binding protein TraC
MWSIKRAAVLPFLELEDNRVFAANGNLLLCYQLTLPEIYTLSEKDFEALHDTWFQGLKSLPAGTVVHKQDVYEKARFDASALPDKTFLAKATRQYFKDRDYMQHCCYLFFVLPASGAFKTSGIVNPFKKVPVKIPEKLNRRAEQFTAAVEDAVAFLNNSRWLEVHPLAGATFHAFTRRYFNGFSDGADTDILLTNATVQAGDHHLGLLAVNSELCFGDAVATSKVNERFTSGDFVFHQGFIDGLGLSLREHHIVNQVLFLDDKHRWRKLLEKKVEELKKSSNFGSQNKLILGKVQEILDRINADDTSRIIRGHLNVLFWDTEADRLPEIASKIKTVFRELDMVPYDPKGNMRKHYILNAFPAFSSNLSEKDVYVTDLKHGLCLFINNTGYRSDASGVLFNDREFNLPVFKDVWDEGKKCIKARNFAIFAPTGEGKSFLANHVLRQFFEMGVRLVIIDLGGSYTKFAQLYPKDYLVLRYEHGKSLGINPFYVENVADLTPDRLEDLAVFLFELMGDGQQADKAASVAMKKLLKYFYMHATDFSLEEFYRFVSQNRQAVLRELALSKELFDLKNLLHLLSEYVGNGLYSFLFQSDADQSYRLEDKRLIVFELDEVRDHKEILAVMLKLIKTAVQRTIWRNRKEKGIILFDEFAKQLKFPNVLESVEFYYQAIRKQEGAIGIILQSINQLPENATAASILENTQVIYSLNNEKGYDALVRRLQLSTHDLHQLKSIRNRLSGAMKYTEIFIKIGKESNIFRLEVPPEVYAAYLTDGADHEQLMELFQETGTMEKAIQKFMQLKNTTS